MARSTTAGNPTHEPTETPATETEAKKYRVTNVVNKAQKRTVEHDLGGEMVVFELGVAKDLVTWEQAKNVAGSPDFEVLDTETNLVVVVSETWKGAGGEVQLLTNQTIAEYAELKDAALRRRALKLPDGDRFRAGGASRDDMIAFLLEYRGREVEARRKLQDNKGKKPGRRDDTGALVMYVGEENVADPRS